VDTRVRIGSHARSGLGLLSSIDEEAPRMDTLRRSASVVVVVVVVVVV
jgi:hypothetical protein